MDLKRIIREIPDFPKEGISFKDITTLFNNPEAFSFVVNSVTDRYYEKRITKVVGLEARGFVFGGALANKLNAGFVPIRKKGKLPYTTVSESYELEYGIDTIEMHADALNDKDIVLIHDDLLATGGTAHAALELVKRANVKEVYFSFICDLEFITTPKKEIIKSFENHILVKY